MSLFSKWREEKTPSPTPEADAAPSLPVKPRPDRSADIAAEESRLAQALSSGDADTLAQMALAATSTRLRQRAAEAVADPERVRELIRLSRGKDSAVYRILTEKRDAWLEVERRAAALQTEIDTVAAGDVFSACLAVALSEGAGLVAAARFAAAGAAISVTRAGAQASAPYRHEIDRLLGG